MKRFFTISTLVMFFLVAGSQKAFAQFDIGPRAGYNLDAEALFVGGEVRFALPVGSMPLQLQPSLNYFFINDVAFVSQTTIQADINVLYPFGVDNQSFTPYAGAGLGITYSSFDFDVPVPGVDNSDTSVGLNLLGGAVFGTGALRPFAQAQFTLNDGTSVAVLGGVLFRFGGQ